MCNCRGRPEDGDDAPCLDSVQGDRLIDLQRFRAIEDIDLAPGDVAEVVMESPELRLGVGP
jgi:hypothetical protein